MTCYEFDKVVTELAGRPVDPSVAGAVAHADACPRCAARLADERRLAAAFKAIIVADANVQAPDDLEQRLRGAFRARLPRLVPPVPVRGAWPPWTFAAAAAIVVCTAVGGSWLAGMRSQSHQPAATGGSSLEVAAPPNAAPGITARRETDHAPSRAGLAVPWMADSTTPPAGARSANSSEIEAAAQPAGAESEEQLATEFVPLPYGGGSMFVESGHLLRVELPRRALTTFGLAVGVSEEEQAEESVQADVLVAEDGLPRAIRFVRSQPDPR